MRYFISEVYKVGNSCGRKKASAGEHIKKSPGGLFFYLAGMFFKVALRYSQNFPTEAMFSRSSGE